MRVLSSAARASKKNSSLRENLPMENLACLFPGQGSQTVGMGRDFFEKFESARKLFRQIDDLAGRPLSKLCFEGPAEELKKTVNTQPTILAASLVAWTCLLERSSFAPSFLAGHSLGEFSALYAAGVLSLESVVQLVERRAQLMENCPAGAMSAVLGSRFEQLEELCALVTKENEASSDLVVVANFNTREQLVVSGSPFAVKAIGEKLKSDGAKVIPLPVGGAFHSPLMQEASAAFDKLIDTCEFKPAKYPVIQNFTARPTKDGNDIKEALKKQMRNSVRWCESVEYMTLNGVKQFIEIGPGKALTGMVKRIDQSAQVFNVEDESGLAPLANSGKALV
jgi:[acyl-carrier-protein] S-malonyltransferase